MAVDREETIPINKMIMVEEEVVTTWTVVVEDNVEVVAVATCVEICSLHLIEVDFLTIKIRVLSKAATRIISALEARVSTAI
jgi:hypothetical protein